MAVLSVLSTAAIVAGSLHALIMRLGPACTKISTILGSGRVHVNTIRNKNRLNPGLWKKAESSQKRHRTSVRSDEISLIYQEQFGRLGSLPTTNA